MPLLSLFLLALCPQTRVIYVNHAATGADDGSSWADAFDDLQSALALATTGDHVWVAQGTYHPTAGTDRYASFRILFALELYGGFNGTESSLAQRDWVAHPTILAGEIGGASPLDNSIHVLKVEHLDPTRLILDGVIVRDGYADVFGEKLGGGMFIILGRVEIRNATFRENYAELSGGAIHASLDLTIRDSTFQENASGFSGGAIRANEVTILDSRLENNHSEYGGGALQSGGGPTMLSNCKFVGNTCSVQGGGAIIDLGGNTLEIMECDFTANLSGSSPGGALMFHQGGELLVDRCKFRMNGTTDVGGAIFIDWSGSNTAGLIANSFFGQNYSSWDRGGAIYSCGGIDIVGNTIVGNAAPNDRSGGVYLGLDLRNDWEFNGPTAVMNNIIWYNTDRYGLNAQVYREFRHPGSTEYCGIQGVLPGDPYRNTGANPQFRSPQLGDFHLKSYSPLINAGHPRTIGQLGAFLFDLEGQPRLQGATVDIGADEAR